MCGHGLFTRWKRYLTRIWPALGPGPETVLPEAAAKAGRILLVKRDNIGDAVLATAFFNLAYEHWQEHDVTVLCGGAACPLLARIYPKWSFKVLRQPREKQFRWERWKPGGLHAEVQALGEFDLAINLRGYRFESELIFDSWIRARAKVALANQAPSRPAERIEIGDARVYGLTLSGGGDGLLEGTRYVCRDILNYRALARWCFHDADSVAVMPRLPLSTGVLDDLLATARNHGASGGRVLALCPYPSNDIRMYPEDKLVAVTTRLATAHGLEVEIIGGPADGVRAEVLRARLQSQGVIVRNLAGRMGLAETAAVLAQAGLVLAVDTGLPHMAIALGTPTVVVLGGGHFGSFGPWGELDRARWLTHRVPCIHCNWHCTQPAVYCITEVTPESLVEAGEALLAASRV